MPWFVFRESIGPQPRIFMHDEAYSSRAAAEQAAWDNSWIRNKPTSGRPVDESIPPFIVEAADEKEAFGKFTRDSFEMRHQTSG